MDIASIFKGISLAKGIAAYVGILENSTQVKLDRLAASEFEAGVRALEQAQKTQNEKRSLLQEARSRFNKAIGLEKNVRKAYAFLGLAICHQYLNDTENSYEALKEILNLTLEYPNFVTEAVPHMARRVNEVAQEHNIGIAALFAGALALDPVRTLVLGTGEVLGKHAVMHIELTKLQKAIRAYL